MREIKFSDYVDFLRNNISNLIEYRELTGRLDPELVKLREGLFNKDPHKVLKAARQASQQFSDACLYH